MYLPFRLDGFIHFQLRGQMDEISAFFQWKWDLDADVIVFSVFITWWCNADIYNHDCKDDKYNSNMNIIGW